MLIWGVWYRLDLIHHERSHIAAVALIQFLRVEQKLWKWSPRMISKEGVVSCGKFIRMMATIIVGNVVGGNVSFPAFATAWGGSGIIGIHG